MNTFISMLRGVNVSGQNRIRMEALRGAYEALGLVEVRSYVQSGNVIFDSEEADASLLTGRIEAQIQKTFGYSVKVFLRGRGDLQRVIAGNPFLKARKEDPSKLHVTFLYGPPSAAALNDLQNPGDAADEFSVGEQEIFLFCPNGYGRTKLNNAFFERKLKLPATTRNWSSVNALCALAGGKGK